METDHNPLVPLLSYKDLNTLPSRIRRLWFCIDQFDFGIQYIPGKEMFTADTLSQSPLPRKGDSTLKELAKLAMAACISHFPASCSTLNDLKKSQASDPICSLLIQYCWDGWPSKTRVSDVILLYCTQCGQFSIIRNLLLFGNRIVIPTAKQQEILEKLH